MRRIKYFLSLLFALAFFTLSGSMGYAQSIDESLSDLESLGGLNPAADTVASNNYTIRALLEPIQSAVLASEMDGKIKRVHKRDGEKFKKGDPLVTFDCGNQQVERQRLKAKLNSSTLIYENALQLQRLNSIGDLDVSLAEAETFVAKAELSAVDLSVKRCVIYAPFSGRVIELARKQHEWISRGDPLMEVFNDEEYLLKMLVPSSWLQWLKLGYSFKVSIDETGKTYDAKIHKIGARIDPVSRSVIVRGKVQSGNAEFLHSMSGNAEIIPPTN